MNYGLQTALKGVEEYLSGQNKIPYIYYNESGDWTKWLPKYEAQADDFESYGCTLWGLQNQVETFETFLYNTEPNYDEWFNYPLIPINARGKAPQVTYESVREHGMVKHGTVDTPDTREESLDLSRITGSMRANGQNWLVQNDFKHEWLWDVKPSNSLEIMRDALKTSPLAVSVSAWYPNGDGMYVDMGQRNNHWCVVYKIDDTAIHVFDSYDNSRKKLTLDHNIELVKRIWLNKKTSRGARQHIKVLESILKALKLMKPTLLDVCTQSIGTDVTPADVISDDVACAEVVTTLLKKVRPKTRLIPGTYTLYQWLKSTESGYKLVDLPEPEDIVISPTGLGKPMTHGHVGICMEDGVIASNDSRTGKFMKNYTHKTWSTRYGGMGYPVFYFRYIT